MTAQKKPRLKRGFYNIVAVSLPKPGNNLNQSTGLISGVIPLQL